MLDRVQVLMLLADSAQIADGKLYILGGGWSVTGPEPSPSAVAIKLNVDRHEIDMVHHWELVLEDADGAPVLVGDDNQPLEIRGEFSVGEPIGVPDGTPVDFPIALGLPPIPLTPGSRFQWRLFIDGETYPGATVAFSTRPAREVHPDHPSVQ
jgi:hypothetical protein